MSTPPPPAVKHYMSIGVGVGWQRRCKTYQSVRELDNQGTVFLGGAVTMMVIEYIILCGVEARTFAQGE